MSGSAFIVRRRFYIQVPVSPATLGAVQDLPGILDVGVEGQRLRVRYDNRKIGYGDIEDALAAAGCTPASGYFPRLYAAFCGFLDGNAKANAGLRGANCCSDPKEIHARRHRR